MKPSPLNSWVSCRTNAWFPWETLSFLRRKILSLPLCQRRSGKGFCAPFWCQSQPRGHPWPGSDYFAVSSMDTKLQMFSLRAKISCCGFRVRLQAGLRAYTKAGWNVNNILLFPRCAGNNAPEGTDLMNQSCVFLEKKILKIRLKGEKRSISTEIKENLGTDSVGNVSGHSELQLDESLKENPSWCPFSEFYLGSSVVQPWLWFPVQNDFLG